MSEAHVDGVSGHSIAPDSTEGALVVRHGHGDHVDEAPFAAI